MKALQKYIPLLGWVRSYDQKDLRGDVSAGLTVAVMLIPQGMAYALLAGMPPIYGLYASTIPLILYALFGTSRQLAVGPVAMVALLIAAGVGKLAEPGSADFIGLAITLALMVGIIQFLLGLFRLGFLVNFLSHPVISGFTSAAAFIIGLSQLKHLLGIDIPRSNFVHIILSNAFQNIDQIHFPTLILGVGGIALIIILKKVNKLIPGPLVSVVLAVLAVYLLRLDQGGLKILKEVPEGFPGFVLPNLELSNLSALSVTAITIALVGFMESFAVAKAIQSKHKNYEIDANQELIGLGVANIGGSFFQAFPTTGGFSRTAVNDQAGAKTGMAAIISALIISLTLLFLTPLFYYLPKAILASIIMVAVFGLIDWKEAFHLWKTDRKDFVMLIATFLATLLIGIEQGIVIGVLLSLGMVIYKSAYPHVAALGRIPGTTYYRNVRRFPEVIQRDDMIIIRFDAQLYFANIQYFQDQLAQLDKEKGNSLKVVIINAEAIYNIDSSAVHALTDIVENYHKRNIQFYMASVIGPVRDALHRSGLVEKIGKENFFMTTEDAVRQYGGDECDTIKIDPKALQTNWTPTKN